MVIEQQRGRPEPVPSVVTDAMLRELHGQRRLFPASEREAALERLIYEWRCDFSVKKDKE
jgi:hypothetical protein